MQPVRTNRSNAVYRGPTVDIGDAWVERAKVTTLDGKPVNAVFMDWQPDAYDRLSIANGATIRLGIWGMEPIPPVSLQIRNDLTIVDGDPPPIIEGAS